MNGAPVVPADVTLSILTPFANPNITIDANGNVDVAANTPAGTYTLTYQICEIANPTNCDTANVTIVIETAVSIIDAVNDPFGPIANNIPHTIDILNNDTLDGAPFNPSVVTVTINPSLVIPGSTFNPATGELTIPAGTTPGTTLYLILSVK